MESRGLSEDCSQDQGRTAKGTRSPDVGRGLEARERRAGGTVSRAGGRVGLAGSGTGGTAEGGSELEAPLLTDCPSPARPQRVHRTQHWVPGPRPVSTPLVSDQGGSGISWRLSCPTFAPGKSLFVWFCFCFHLCLRGIRKFQNRVAISALPTSEEPLEVFPRRGTWFSRFWNPQP